MQFFFKNLNYNLLIFIVFEEVLKRKFKKRESSTRYLLNESLNEVVTKIISKSPTSPI